MPTKHIVLSLHRTGSVRRIHHVCSIFVSLLYVLILVYILFVLIVCRLVILLVAIYPVHFVVIGIVWVSTFVYLFLEEVFHAHEGVDLILDVLVSLVVVVAWCETIVDFLFLVVFVSEVVIFVLVIILIILLFVINWLLIKIWLILVGVFLVHFILRIGFELKSILYIICVNSLAWVSY